MERLKQPKRSPASESAPHWRTIAAGRYISTVLDMICRDWKLILKKMIIIYFPEMVFLAPKEIIFLKQDSKRNKENLTKISLR